MLDSKILYRAYAPKTGVIMEFYAPQTWRHVKRIISYAATYDECMFIVETASGRFIRTIGKDTPN